MASTALVGGTLLLGAAPAPALSIPGFVAACTTADFDAATAAGGQVTFGCNGTITLDHTLSVPSGGVLDLEGTGHQVTLQASRAAAPMFDVEGGNLTLLNITVEGGLGLRRGEATYASSGAAGPAGVLGTPGTPPVGNGPGGAGGAGGAGGSGGAGSAGTATEGDGIHIGSGSATIGGCTFGGLGVVGEGGGSGGNAGAGGQGGGGGGDLNAFGGLPGSGGDAGAAGVGGAGGAGGDGQGGAIWNAGTLVVTDSTFTDDGATGGAGGGAGFGGAGASGGGNGIQVQRFPYKLLGFAPSGHPSAGGAGGRGGAGGNGEGGAIWNSGVLTVTDTHFGPDGAIGAGGGEGGGGGNGAFGGLDGHGNGATASDGGAAGGSGASGAGLGGAIYDVGRSILSGLTFSGNVARGGSGPTGGGGLRRGGSGGPGADAVIVDAGPPAAYGRAGDGGAGGAGSDGADGGKPAGGAYFGPTLPTNSVATGDSVAGGQPGTTGDPGFGGPGGKAPNEASCSQPQNDCIAGVPGNNGANGAAGHPGVVGSASGADFSTATPLTVDFAVVATPGEPGGRDFIATPTDDGQGNPLVFTWDFGDGTIVTSSATIHHDYSKPGTFSVVLTATDVNGQTGTAAHTVKVAAPTLTVAIAAAPAGILGCTGASAPPPSTPSDLNPDPGQAVLAGIYLTAGTDGVGDLSDLTFNGPPLQISPAGRLTVTSGPQPAVTGPITLSPGQQVTFTYCLKTVTLGPGTLSSEVTGQDASGAQVTASGQQVVPIGRHLTVTLTATPNPITVTDDADGNPVATPFSVAVTVTNPFTKSLTDVVITRPLSLAKVGATKTIPVTQKGDPSPGNIDLGALAPGQSVTTHVAFDADVDGSVIITANASAPNPDAPTESVTGVGHTQVDINPTALLTIRLDLGAQTCTTPAGLPAVDCVTAGRAYDVYGVLTNITNGTSVQLDPLSPTLDGNASGGNPVDLAGQGLPSPGTTPVSTTGGISFDNPCGIPSPPTGAATFPGTFPVPIAPDLQPLDTKAFGSQVYTLPDGVPRSTIGFTPTGTVTLDDGTTRPLTAADVLYVGPDGDHESVTVDYSTADPPPATFGTLAANFTIGLGEGICQWTVGQLTTVPTLLNSLGNILEQIPQDLLQTFDYLVTWYGDLTPQQRDDWVSAAATSIASQTADSFDSAKAKVDNAVTAFFTPLTSAMASGDLNTVANIAGQATGNVYLEAPLWFIHVPGAGNVVRLADEAQQAGTNKRLSQGLADLLPGDDLLAATDPAGHPALNGEYGMTDAQTEGLQQYAADNKLLIGVRSRNPLSIAWEKLGAVLKPENIKIKTVSEIDWRYLGYAQSDEARVIFREPITQGQFKANTQGLSGDELAAVTNRYNSRIKEWNKYLKTYQGYERTGIPVGFDYQAQGIPSEQWSTNLTTVGFNLEAVPDPTGAGQQYFVVQMADNRGALQSVTGDIDVVSITAADGRVLSIDERLDAYFTLEDTLGMQHGETFSWLHQGEALDPVKADLLGAHTYAPGNEPLALFGPDGVRAAFVDPHKTFFDTTTGVGRIWFVGGYKTPYFPHFASLYDANVKAIAGDASKALMQFVTPAAFQQQLDHSQGQSQQAQSDHAHQDSGVHPTAAFGGSDQLTGVCTWQFSTDPTAAVVQPDGRGGLEQFTASGVWSPLDLSTCSTGAAGTGPFTAGHSLRILPESVLDVGVLAGSNVLKIDDLGAVAPFLPAATTPWFSSGQQIIIDPGSPDAETATIASVDPLTLVHPLSEPHGVGEMVTVAPSVLAASVGSPLVNPTPAPAPASGTPSVVIAAPAPAIDGITGPLAFTGVDTLRWLAAGGLFVILGLAMALIGRRRTVRRT